MRAVQYPVCILNLYLLQQQQKNVQKRNNKYDLQNNHICFFLSSLTFFSLIYEICVYNFEQFNIRTNNCCVSCIIQ